MASFLATCLGAAVGGLLLALPLVLPLRRRVERLEDEMLTVLEASVRSTARDLAAREGGLQRRSQRWLQ